MKNFEKEFKKTTLWKYQYAPRDRILRYKLKGETLKKYRKLSLSQKIKIIDLFQSEGYFEK